MSLFTSFQVANNALTAAQLGLQVTGNNIANANTPGYIRERVQFEPAPTQRIGDLIVGTGVSVTAITQQIDRFLQERLRTAAGDLENGQAQESAYTQLEGLIGELSGTDLSTALTNFFGSLNDVVNQPESDGVRNLAVLQGKRLADDVRSLDSRVRKIRNDVNNRIVGAADDINRLLEKIAKLNFQITTAEGGGTLASDAVGLRDKRENALTELAKLVDVRAIEQPTGAVNVLAGGEILIFDATFREVKAVLKPDGGENLAEIRLAETDSPLHLTSGSVAGLTAARDEILGGFLGQLNDFARTLAFEFNKVFSSGQGLTGFTQLTSEKAVKDAAAALDQAGLPFTPVHGAFQVQVVNKQSGLTRTTDVFVELNGLSGDMTLTSLAATLNNIDGLSASITLDGRLSLRSDSPDLSFSFADDTSGVLAALGLNTFFTGSSAATLGINDVVRKDPSKFASSRGGVGEDANNAVLLAGLLDAPLDPQNGASLAQLYDRFVGGVTQSAAAARSVAEGFRTFHQALEGQQLATSGVSLDEEAVKMITYQRAFQASARFIVTISELLDVLVKL